MKSIKILLLLLFVSINFCLAQDTTLVLTPTMLDKDSVQIYISEMKGWLFKQGNDTAWANKEIDVTNWKRLMPTGLSEKMADKNGLLEGWFRIKIKPDSSFGETRFGIKISTWAASDLYIDGKWIASFGNSGLNGLPYKENIFKTNLRPEPVNLKPGNEYTIALHVVDYISHLPRYELKSKDHGLRYLIRITVPKYDETLVSGGATRISIVYSVAGIIFVLCLFFWILFFQNRREKNLLLFAMTSTFLIVFMVCGPLLTNEGVVSGSISYAGTWLCIQLGFISQFLYFASIPLILARIFKRNFPVILTIIFLFYLFFDIFQINQIIDLGEKISEVINYTLVALFIIPSLYYVVTSWKSLKGAQWAIVNGLLISIFFLFFGIFIFPIFQASSALYLMSFILTFMAFPMSLLIYVAMRFKEMIHEAQENARQVVQMSEEKGEQALNQQKILQEEVTRQTAEIRTTLDHLKSTQSQLIQSEKLASLGELTAGIAHEIQNPLNFVNNFSELSVDLIKEIKDERQKPVEKRDEALEDELLNDLSQNQEKINHHGKRAASIVSGMLQHARTSTGKKEPTDLNALADEYLRLSYHGLRAKNSTFNASMVTDFDPAVGMVEVIPQDMGRVLLNIIINAFYATQQRKTAGQDFRSLKDFGSLGAYEPTVSISSKKMEHGVELRIKDNGTGIPDEVKARIFQPFFTTKPTGQGTGLGLSLAYDIVVKGHGGTLEVESTEGAGTEFVITLPDK